MDNDPKRLSAIVSANAVRVKMEPDAITAEEAFEEIIDMISYYVDDPSDVDLETANAALNEELRAEFPGHSAIVRRLSPDSARIVINGPRYSCRCSITNDMITLD